MESQAPENMAVDELDERRIIQRIRDDLSLRARNDQPFRPSPDVAPVTEDLSLLHSGYDIYYTAPIKSPRKILGPILTFTRKLARRLMAPILKRQVAYNAANTRVVQEHACQVHELKIQLERSVAQIQELKTQLKTSTPEQRSSVAQIQELKTQLETSTLEQRSSVAQIQELKTQLETSTLEQRSSVAQIQELKTQLETSTLEQRSSVAQIQELKTQLETSTLEQRSSVAQIQELQTQFEKSALEQRSSITVLHGALDRCASVAQTFQSVQDRTVARQQELGGQIGGLRVELDRAVLRLDRLSRRIAALGRPPLHDPASAGRKESHRGGAPLAREFDYAGLEDRFRGSEAEIKDRQRRYLKYFLGKEPVLDIGSGRGEFLELLSEAGMKATGVDLDRDMVLLCQEKGLEIVQSDAFSHLEEIPDGSLGGVFCAQFIEHCRPHQVFRLAQLCEQKLRAGGVLVFETINPKCLAVFARAFYLDPTHVWPFHPELSRFILETAGFSDIALEFFSPVDAEVRIPHLAVENLSGQEKERLDRAVDIINELLFGDQDYAIVAIKPHLEAAEE
jgi:2-polyprenyl-3-methyl-5-hydroxy-6-metoxy-1,4-benzoquinol methylase